MAEVSWFLEAAERVPADDAGASVGQIAEAAGLARVTVHRRFANRQKLLETLAVSAKQQLIDTIEDARPDTAQDPDSQDPDALATLVIDTFLHGAGPHG